MTHHQNDKARIAKVEKIDLGYVEQLAKLLKKMQAAKDLADLGVADWLAADDYFRPATN